MSRSSEEELLDIKPPVISEEALLQPRNGLPLNSSVKYQKAYEDFIQWKTEKKAKSFSENVLLVYFDYLSKKKRPSTLWCEYSKLKSTLRLKENVNIGDYTRLIAFLKRKSVGYKPKKSKVLSGNNIEMFIKEAPDKQYLLEKVILIFGINGACRSNELTALTINDIETHNDKMIVCVRCPTKDRRFIIHDELLEVVQKYQQLRPVGIKSDRFFLNFKNGKCTQLPVGRHKIAAIPQLIAKYLNLPDAESYTGHCFRRSSATLLANKGADLTTLKSHGGWLSNKVAEGYIKESILNQPMFTTQIHEGTSDIVAEGYIKESIGNQSMFTTQIHQGTSDKVAEGYIKESIGNQPMFTTQIHEGTSDKVAESYIKESIGNQLMFTTQIYEGTLDKVAEGYIKESIENQPMFTTQIHEGTLKSSLKPELSTSTDPLESFDTKIPEASSIPSSTENSSKNVEVNLTGKTIQLSLSNLTNCHISINFN